MSASGWSVSDQHAFVRWMGQVLSTWQNATEIVASQLFDGSDSSILVLTDLISDGKLTEGIPGDPSQSQPKSPSDSELQEYIKSAFYVFMIPAAWNITKAYPFVIDVDKPCGTKDPLLKYLDQKTGERTYVCFNSRMYYLVAASGSAQSCMPATTQPGSLFPPSCTDSHFKAPLGIDELDGSYGHITRGTLVAG